MEASSFCQRPDHRFSLPAPVFLFLRSSHFLSFSSTFCHANSLSRLRVQRIMVKGSKSDKETTYEFRDIVLAKVRGYPPWPGMVRSSFVVFLKRLLTYYPFLFLIALRSWIRRPSQKKCSENVLITKSHLSTAYGSFPKETSKLHTIFGFTLR